VETVFIGKNGRYNSYNWCFLQMCRHHLVDPVACRTASGWDKGQVENQVGLVPRALLHATAALSELNAWLLDQCLVYVKAHRHPSALLDGMLNPITTSLLAATKVLMRRNSNRIASDGVDRPDCLRPIHLMHCDNQP
jgi:hypothetical protein